MIKGIVFRYLCQYGQERTPNNKCILDSKEFLNHQIIKVEYLTFKKGENEIGCNKHINYDDISIYSESINNYYNGFVHMKKHFSLILCFSVALI